MMDFNRENTHRCPCKECPDKGCGEKHDTCPEYLAWRKVIDARNGAERAHRESNNTMSDDRRREIWKRKRYSSQGYRTHKTESN